MFTMQGLPRSTRIATLNPNHPEATSFTVKDGRVIGVDDGGKYMDDPNIAVIGSQRGVVARASGEVALCAA